MPIPDNQLLVAQVNMKGTVASAGSTARAVDNVYFFRRTTNVNTPSEIALETAFDAAIAAPVIAALNIRYTQTVTDVRFIDDAERQTVSVTRTGAGAITGDSMPAENQVFVLLRSALRGKAYRGGKRYWPLSESDTSTATADILNVAAATRFGTIMAAILAGFTDANSNIWVPCVFSRSQSWVKTNPTTITTADVVQLLLNQRVTSNKKHKVASVY